MSNEELTDEVQGEAYDLQKMAETVGDHLDNASGCEVGSDVKANVLEALEAAKELVAAITILAKKAKALK